ncbi:DNA phosphorothioation-dependent restriction protein DptF [Pontibacterium sp.]|uniref:DNA phosphorothioation-dependent restriction protein DptF n=1 Tax=Pontibacterium sp. TaxID=2036026 RepID=UPI003513718C
MKLSSALTVLSKSSPYAVRTQGAFENPHFEKLKEHLYVETEIERAFASKLHSLQPGEILFLCGSSGDGKSEILTRYQKEHTHIKFHLDATHSFSASSTAIETLDALFTEQRVTNLPMIVGINIGMLGNYQQDGSRDHLKIRKAIARFLIAKEIQVDRISFLDFEAFPKFRIEEHEVRSEFFSGLLDKVVRDSHDNPFRSSFELSRQEPGEQRLCANYRLLRLQPVQRAIVELLFQARVRKDQFITARMLLDFIHCILTGPGHLFDNLFDGGDNELLHVLADFDPAILRSREIDRFLIEHQIGIEDSEYDRFNQECTEKLKIDAGLGGLSQLRLFFLVRHSRMSTENRFLQQFNESFTDEVWLEYCHAWQLHREYEGEANQKQYLKHFYADIVFNAINRFANRSAPQLSKDEYFISVRGSYVVAAELELSVPYRQIQNDRNHDQSFFNLYISVGDTVLKPVPVTINLLDLMCRIVNGYRPNRHDKNSIVLLEDLVHHITSQARKANSLHLYKQGGEEGHFRLRQTPDEELRVSGL